MGQQNLFAYAKATLLKIHVITGWTIPKDDLLIILIDQFIKKLIEGYPNVNPEEIEYAFRNYGTTVKDWGKSMNLSLIDEVMIPYLEQRFELSRVEEQKAPQIEYKPDLEQIEREYQEFLQTDLGKKLNPKI